MSIFSNKQEIADRVDICRGFPGNPVMESPSIVSYLWRPDNPIPIRGIKIISIFTQLRLYANKYHIIDIIIRYLDLNGVVNSSLYSERLNDKEEASSRLKELISDYKKHMIKKLEEQIFDR